jgi:flagellar motor switch protein FliM
MTTSSVGSRTSEPLSQKDIDKLLQGQLERPTVLRPNAGDVQVYDFHRPYRVSTERLKTLEAMYGRFVKSLEGWVMGRVRGLVSLKMQSVELFSFGEFMLSLPPSCNSFIVDIRNKDGEQALGEQAVIDIGRELSFFLVDRLFGGGADPTIPDRVLTPIERMAVRVVAERIMNLVGEIWHDHVELEMSLAGFESIPDIIQAAPREAPALVTNIMAQFAGASSLVSICLPLSVLEKFFANTSTKVQSNFQVKDNPAQRVAREETLRATRVELGARLPEFRLTMRDIAGLRVGSLLSTGIPIESHVNLCIGAQARFRTAPGRVGRKLAVRVLEPLGATPLPNGQDDSR